MVQLHVKRGNDSLFLFETETSSNIGLLLTSLVTIHNGRLKIQRLCYEIEELSKYGVCLPPDMQGLTQDQVTDMKLTDSWAERYLVSSDYMNNPDPMGKRNGKAPKEKYAEILTKTTAEAKARIGQKLVESGVCLTTDLIKDTLDILRGSVTICYPMGLPPYDVIQMELDGKEDLTGTQASKTILEDGKTDLWWANKLLDPTKFLGDYVGKNEKSKLVVKLHKKGLGAPAREPVLSEEQRKDLMMAEFRRREELKRLDEDDDDSHLDSRWADNNNLKKTYLGLNKIRFK